MSNYYYDKYAVILEINQDGTWITPDQLDNGYPTPFVSGGDVVYEIIPTNPITSGSGIYMKDADENKVYLRNYDVGWIQSLLRRVGSQYFEYYNDIDYFDISGFRGVKGELVTSNIELDDTYPVDGVHTDGFYYVRGARLKTYVNKIIYDGNTLIDLTEDTVTEESLVLGKTAHRADGEPIVGTLKSDKYLVDLHLAIVAGIPNADNLLYLNENITNIPDLTFDKATSASYAFCATNVETVGDLSFPLATSADRFLYGSRKLKSIGNILMPNVTSMYGFLSDCSDLETIGTITTSNNQDFSYFHYRNRNMEVFPQIDTSNGTVFGYMYYDCSNGTTFPQIDTSNGTVFNSMYSGCSSGTTFPQIDTSNGTDFGYMYYYVGSAVELPFVDCSNATTVNSMYGFNENLEFVPYIFKNGRATPEPTYNNIFSSSPNLDFERMRADGWEEKYLATAPNYIAP